MFIVRDGPLKYVNLAKLDYATTTIARRTEKKLFTMVDRDSLGENHMDGEIPQLMTQHIVPTVQEYHE